MSGDYEGENEKWVVRMLLLLPGFFSLAVARHMVSSEEIDNFSLVSYSLAFSLANFVIAAALYRTLPMVLSRIFRRKSADPTPREEVIPRLSLGFAVTVLTLSIALGLGAGYAYSSDLMLASLRHGPFARTLTKRSVGRPLVFLLAANRQGKLEEGRPKALKQGQVWVEVYLKDSGKVFSGYPEFFPIGKEMAEVFLSPACVLEPKIQAWPGPGVLIREDEISYISFVDRERSACHNLWRDISAGLETKEATVKSTVP